jgi:hypothetical protein
MCTFYYSYHIDFHVVLYWFDLYQVISDITHYQGTEYYILGHDYLFSIWF